MVRGERGQVTLFVVLGVVLVIVFGFALFARSLTIQDQVRAEAENMVSNYLQANSITYYVNSNLQQISEELLQRVGEQGGEIRFEFGIDDYLSYALGGKKYNVSYGLVPNTYCPQVEANSPNYPLANTYLNSLNYGCSEPLNGFFGANIIPKLCDAYGQNSQYQTDEWQYFCETYTYGYEANKTIQGKLEFFIENELKERVDFSHYELRGHNVSLQKENINVSVIYGFEQVTINAVFPFEVDVGGKKPILSQRTFSQTIPVRLRSIYTYATNLIAQDAENHSFNISRDYAYVPFYKQEFNVTYWHNVCDSCITEGVYDNILRIEDPSSRLANEAYVFQVAIRNRRPALDRIHETGGGGEYDIRVLENQTITLRPRGYDPDDTSVEYFYSGWKETSDEYFDFTSMINNGCETLAECVRPLPGEPRNWTNSLRYRLTAQEANITVFRRDTGPHNVRITILDEEGLEDYQEVRVLVFDLPEAVPNGSSGMAGVDSSQASIEDPYLLNGTASKVSQIAEYLGDANIGRYEWRAKTNENYLRRFLFYIDTPYALTWIPGVAWRHSFGINITQVPFNYTNWTLVEPLTHTINLTVTSGGMESPAVSFDIEVHQCIPYRNSTGLAPYSTDYIITSYSYPYNTTQYNVYDHTCCAGSIDENGMVDVQGFYQNDVVCYNATEYGSFLRFESQDYESYGLNPAIAPPQRRIRHVPSTTITNSHSIYANDIYLRNITRGCSGDRGNTCTGDITDLRVNIQACGDDFPFSSQVERCQGPAYGESTLVQQYCVNYDFTTDDKSFEEVFGLTKRGSEVPANGICDSTPRCSTPDEYNTGTGSPGISLGGGCSGGSCSYPANYQACGDELVCQTSYPFRYQRVVSTCIEQADGSGQCGPPVRIDQWGGSRCENPDVFLSRYCGTSTYPQPGRCTATSCCDASDLTTTNPCKDPCTLAGVDSQCILTSRSGVIAGIDWNEGRSCQNFIQGLTACATVTNYQNCQKDATGQAGYCETGGTCTPKLSIGSPCTAGNNHECLSGYCHPIIGICQQAP